MPDHAKSRGDAEPWNDETVLYVATDLTVWPIPKHLVHMLADDVTLEDKPFRRLDAPYYAYLRSRMECAKKAYKSFKMGLMRWEYLRQSFNAVHEWALGHIGHDALLDAMNDEEALASYAPPVPLEQTFGRRL